jgi:3-isopropylmalate/(R)-2-methylmalate dehydratase small subunit
MDSRTVTGRAWRLGENIDIDLLTPSAYMKLPEDHSSQPPVLLQATFTRLDVPGNIVVADTNFGLLSSREQAAQALKMAGVDVVLAQSFGRVFYRNAINLGLPALFFPFAEEIAAGDRLEVDLAAGDVRNLTTGWAYCVEPIPRKVMRIIRDGGLIPHLRKRLAKRRVTHKGMLLRPAMTRQ